MLGPNAPLSLPCIDCGSTKGTMIGGTCPRCAAKSPAPAVATTADPRRFRPLGSLALALQICFGFWMVVGGIWVAAEVIEYRLVSRAIDNPFAVSFEQIETADDRRLRLLIVSLVAYAVIGVIFVTWTHRAYRNIPVLGLTGKRFADGWAIGSWLVPFLNLVRPKQIVDEVWKSGAVVDNTKWKFERVPWQVHAWWATVVLGRLVGVQATTGRSTDSIETLQFKSLTSVVATSVELVGAVLAFWVVSRATKRQADHAAAVGVDNRSAGLSRRIEQVAMAGLVLIAGVTITFAYLSFDAPAASSAVETDAGRYDRYGVSFEYPDGYLAAETSGTGSGEPTEAMGMVAMTGERRRDSLLAVEWILLPNATAEDHLMAVNLLIDALSGITEIPLVRTGSLRDVEAGLVTAVAKAFSIDGEDATVSGAVAAGTCPEGSRIFAARSFYDGLGHEEAALDQIRRLLDSLTC